MCYSCHCIVSYYVIMPLQNEHRRSLIYNFSQLLQWRHVVLLVKCCSALFFAVGAIKTLKCRIRSTIVCQSFWNPCWPSLEWPLLTNCPESRDMTTSSSTGELTSSLSVKQLDFFVRLIAQWHKLRSCVVLLPYASFTRLALSSLGFTLGKCSSVG